MDRREEILSKRVAIRQDCVVDSSVVDIFDAMDDYMKECCLELLQYLAKNKVRISTNIKGQPIFEYKGEWITREQLFENFL